MEKKYQIDTMENRKFLEEIRDTLLSFGHQFPSLGGSSYYLGDDGTPWTDRIRETYVTSRMVHVYSIGSFLGHEGSEELIDVALKGLCGELHDEKCGGWYAGIMADGKIVPNKQCYAHAFVILAASSAMLAERPGAEKLLENALKVYDEKFWNEEEGLSCDTWNTEFTELDPYRGLNANMHTVEAFLAAADVLHEEKYRVRAGRIIDHVLEWAAGNEWRIPEHYSEDWIPDLECNKEKPDDQFKPYGATPGHGLEWSRLIIQWALSTYPEGTESMKYLAAAENLYCRAVEDAWECDGAPGIVYTTDWEGKPIVHDRMHWTLAEAINSAAVLYHVTKKKEYAKDYEKFMKYLDEKVWDHVNGSCFHQLDQENKVIGTVWPGKPDIYHALQAALIPYSAVDLSIAPAVKRAYAKKGQKKMYAIGIDIGTTSICGVVIDAMTGKVVCSRTEPNDTFIETQNLWEKIQDIEKIIATAKKILKAFEDYPTLVIGLTGQMHGIVYVDEKGKAVSPLYTWQDGRGNLPYQTTTYAKYLGSSSGYGNVTDFYNRIHQLRPKEAVSYCTIMDYLGMVLCGLKKPCMHITNAASLGCFDMENKKFSYDIKIDLCDGYELLGTYHGIPVSAAIGDNQASVFSTLADEKDILLNIGTGSQVSVISEHRKNGENIETRPYFDGKYLIVGSALCGGRAYRILKDFYQSFLEEAGIKEADVYAIMGKMLDTDEKNEHENTLTVDTRFSGTREDTSVKGKIEGISTDNFTPGNLTKGFLKGMISELHELYASMEEQRINLIGSGNAIRKNKALVKAAEQKFGGHLKIPCHVEEAAYGAALYGLLANKDFENVAQVQALINFQ